MPDIIRYAQGDSSLGTIVVAMSDRGLAMIEFGDVGDRPFMHETLARLSHLIEHPEGRTDLPLDMRGTEFELRVWNALREIHAGHTVTYGEVAARIGSPREAREVAEACAANALAVVVPCHRVVKKDGSIAGYRWGFKRKRALIERERRVFSQVA